MRRTVARTNCDGFSLIEVMIAMAVVSLVVASSITATMVGFRLLDDARFSTLSSQVLQSEMENIRLKNWVQISSLPATETFSVDSSLNTASFNRFKCTRAITDVRTDVKKVTLTASWKSPDGRLHYRRYITYVTRNGLNDYFYRKI